MTRHARIRGVRGRGSEMTVRDRARTRTWFALGALVLAAGLAGCSGSDGTGGSDAAGLAAATTPAPSGSPAGDGTGGTKQAGAKPADTPEDDGPPSAERELRRVTRIT